MRLASIQALDALVSGGVAAGLVDSLVAPGVRPVTYDRAPNVREAIFAALGHWLGAPLTQAQQQQQPTPTEAPQAEAAVAGTDDRGGILAHQHGHSLLPLLLVGVTDPTPAVAMQALELVEAVGRAWEGGGGSSAGGGGSSMDIDARPASDPVVTNDPATAMVTNEAATGSEAGGADGFSVEAAVSACRLPVPYHGRPARGARLMARCLLPQLLPPALRDLAEWTVLQRVCASRSLHTTLVRVGGWAGGHTGCVLVGEYEHTGCVLVGEYEHTCCHIGVHACGCLRF